MMDSNHLPPVSRRLKKHELNNEGCRCRLCQKIIIQQNMRITKKQVYDYQSECYSNHPSQNYIQIINALQQFDSNPRKIKFALPEICIFSKGAPQCIISKKKQRDLINIVRNKSKLHLFEIFNFFLEGFMYHNPGRTEATESVGRRKSNYLELLRAEPVVLAKYVNNNYQMLNLTQVQGLFKSKLKYLKDGLMYLQTLVSSKNYQEERVRIIIDEVRQTPMFERAKKQVKIIVGQIKSTDIEYINEVQENNYEKQLKKSNINQSLRYLVLKIILLLSKRNNKIMQDSLFKLLIVKDIIYIWDVRVYDQSSSQQIWAQSAKAAFQYKLAKQMAKMEAETPNHFSFPQIGQRAKNLSQWLRKSTQNEVMEISSIRKRLDKLENQKRSLMQSQSCEEGYLNKTFKVKNKRKII